MQLTIRSYWQKISNHVSERHPLVYKVTSYNSSYYKKSMHLHLGFVRPHWCAVVLCFHCVWWQVTQRSCSLVVPLTAVLSFLPWHSRSPVTNHSYNHTTESKQALSMKNEGKQVATVHKHTHTHTRLTALYPGLPEWASARKVKPSGFYWSKRQWVAVASAGPYASLYLAPDR